MSEITDLKQAIKEHAGYVREYMLQVSNDPYAYHTKAMLSLDYLLKLAEVESVDWEARAVLEAKRVFANGERATAAEYALRYIIEKLQHHHTSRPGISEIIKSAKRLYKDSGGTTLFAPDKSGDSTAASVLSQSEHSPAQEGEQQPARSCR